MTGLEEALAPDCPWVIYTSRIEMLPLSVREKINHDYSLVGGGIGLRRDAGRPESRERLRDLRHEKLESFW